MKTIGYIPKKDEPKDGAKPAEKGGGGKTETPKTDGAGGNGNKPKEDADKTTADSGKDSGK